MKNNFPNATFNSSIDFVCLSLTRFNKSQHQLIKNNCTFETQFKDSKGFYSWIEAYSININGNEYAIMLQFPSSVHPFAPVCLKLLHPDKNLILAFNHLLRTVRYHVSTIELSFDFITNNLNQMYDYLKERVSLKWPGSQLNLNHKSTTYYNNIRTARSKGSRLYKKGTGIPVPAVRLELLLKRDPLRSHKINRLSDVSKIDYKLIKKYLELKEFNFRLFRLRYFKDHPNSSAQYIRIENKIKTLLNSGNLHAANKLAKQVVIYSCLKDCVFNKLFFKLLENYIFIKFPILI